MRHMPVVLALTVIAASPATALDMPTRKTGLWEMKMVFDGRNMPAQTMQQCIDPVTDKAMQARYGGAQGSCSKQDVTNAGGTMTFDAVCTVGPATTTTHGVIAGSFDSAYTMKITSTREGGPPVPGMAAGGESRMTIEAKYLGACQAGQKPGDIIMGNGMKMNVLEMPKMGPGGGMMPGR
jgi:hypothetical protein